MTFPRPPRSDAPAHAARSRPAPRSALDGAILLTVLYADLFDYPLAEEELYRRLAGASCERTAFRHALAALTGPYLAHTKGFYTWAGREHLVAVRRRREGVAGELWAAARRYGRWLARVPFVRMVAVSGSLAVGNAEAGSDIDLFCVTAPKRLWLARTFIVPLSKLTHRLPRLFPLYLCPNYILTLDALDVEDRNLFTAHEVAQAVPLWDGSAYGRFVAANPWVYDFLPHSRFAERPRTPPPRRPWFTRWAEGALRGRLGDRLDRLMHRLFVAFYRRRAERAGWPWHRLAPAYRRDRYTVPEGGYVRVIRRLFAQRVRERLGPHTPTADLDRLFALPDGETGRSVYDWEKLFAEEYGVPAANGAQQNEK